MKNTSENLPDKERIKIIDEYSSQLGASGYSAAQTRRIITAGLTGYQGLVERVNKGETVIHRSAAEGFNARKRKKLLGPSNWFKTKQRVQEQTKKKKVKSKSDEPEVITVMFVPQTPGGELCKRLQRAEERISKLTGEKVRMVERAGTTVRQLLHRSNHWSGGPCGRDKCLPCLNGNGKQDCKEKNIVYDITCGNCEAKEQKTVYTGMTSRTAFERGKEHISKLNGCAQDSALYKHTEEVHFGEEVKFKMKTVKKHFSSLQRTLHEAVRIRRQSENPNIISLNSRGEFGFCSLSRLTISTKECPKNDDKQSSETIQNVFEFRESKEGVSKKRKLDSKDDPRHQKLKHQSHKISKYFISNNNSTDLHPSFNKPNLGRSDKKQTINADLNHFRDLT